jgi:error-prone DNA polymerase
MVPLVVRSHYSLMQGVNSIEQLCRAAARMGYDRLALTDIDNLYGMWNFIAACQREGLRPIIGAEVSDPASGARAVCLVENDRGYRNLCRLLTRRHMADAFDLRKDLPAGAAGMTILTRDAGLLERWHDAGVRVAADMSRKPLPGSHPLCCAARHLGVPIVATPGSFFLEPGEWPIHQLLRAIDQNTVLSALSADDVAPVDAWLADPGTYAERFAICPDALRASRKIAERLVFQEPDFGMVLPPWNRESGNRENRREENGNNENGQNADTSLREAVYAGAALRYGGELPESVVERIEHELRIIADMGFAAYFLVVKSIVGSTPRTCGRGSGAASIVSFCLGITNVCPLKHNLYFERFLNPGRQDPPDLDIDFAWDERDNILENVLTEYKGHAAMVANHVSFQPRMALREVAKVYGLTGNEIGRIAKGLPYHFRARAIGSDLMASLESRPESRHLDYPDPWPAVITLAQRIMGIPRYLSVHPGGVVITPRPIDEYVPLERAPKGVPIMQWEKDGAEDAGLVKIDLLGNRSLGVIRDAVTNAHCNGIVFDESAWEPEDDFATQEALAHGHTMGCFYIESPAMRLLQKKARVGDFDHLVIHSSIIRPAANEFIREYIRRLHGGAWDPIHPLLADVLDETFGIMVYQEDVSRAAVSTAGFSHAEADGLRKIMSKKDREHALQDVCERFHDGAKRRGVSEKKIQEIWAMMMSFSGYSFCKPHSASYARVSFQAAYLKVHFPAEFMAAVISNQGGFYSTFAYVSESRRMGIDIDPPDVNHSDIAWKGSGQSMRVGLLTIKALSAKCRERIIARRRERPFHSLSDFLGRVRPEETEARALINCGALDAFCSDGNRATLMWALAQWFRECSETSKTRTLFDDDEKSLSLPVLPTQDERERLRREYATLGFLCDRHPMTLYKSARQRTRTVKATHLRQFVGRRICFAGWLITGKKVRTKHGDTMEFLTFEDEGGIVETTFFPAVYERFCHMVDRNRPYLLHGKVEEDWGAITLTVDRVNPL